MKEDSHCRDCRYCDIVAIFSTDMDNNAGLEDGLGYCRFNAPVVTVYAHRFPVVLYETDWCREFEAREQDTNL